MPALALIRESDTTARFVAAMREPLQELPAAVSGRLADLVAAIEEIEAVLQPSGAAAGGSFCGRAH
jgi:hypothetical protein